MLPVWGILLLPLASALVIAFFLQRFDRAAAGVGIASISLCFLLTLSLPFWTMPAQTPGGRDLPAQLDASGMATGQVFLYRDGSQLGSGIRRQWDPRLWIGTPAPVDAAGKSLPSGAPDVSRGAGVEIRFGVMMDNLAWAMTLIVTLVGLLVHIFSVGYLAHEGAWGRYFAGLSLFCFSMLGIVLSPNYFQTFMFWELVGVSSYILIGHYYDQDNPPEAAKKAFMTNRVADFVFMTGILALFERVGTVDFHDLAGAFDGVAANELGWPTAIGVMLFVGCMGKSAQFPFHIWLPDAMAGPTPVSALMHAATMVAAGVYLVLRSYPVYTDGALQVIAWVGGITALMAATIAIVQNDIKKVLAYSTLSQLGYMMLALGLAGFADHAAHHEHAANAADFVVKYKSSCYTAGMFHLTTHAFFKALLFLASGAVIVGMHHHQDMLEMGGLFGRMPITAVAFLVGSLALAGIPPLAGFFSKDAILHLAHQGHPVLFAMACVAAFCTAFYMGRAWFLTFMGEPRSEHASHAHEVDGTMWVPLVVLMVFSVVSGILGHEGVWFLRVPGSHGSFSELIYFAVPTRMHLEWSVAFTSIAIAVFGIGLSYAIYGLGAIPAEWLAEKFSGPHQLLVKKYYCDEIALFLVQKVQDTMAKVLDLLEQQIVIGIGVYGFARLWRRAGGVLRYYQSGNVRDYAALLLAGTLAVLYLVTYSSASTLGG